MPIKPGEHPETDPPSSAGQNKFIGFGGEGHRGLLLSVSKDRKSAVILAMTTSAKKSDGIRWGNLYLVREDNPGMWPVAVKELGTAVAGEDWDIIMLIPMGVMAETASA